MQDCWFNIFLITFYCSIQHCYYTSNKFTNLQKNSGHTKSSVCGLYASQFPQHATKCLHNLPNWLHCLASIDVWIKTSAPDFVVLYPMSFGTQFEKPISSTWVTKRKRLHCHFDVICRNRNRKLTLIRLFSTVNNIFSLSCYELPQVFCPAGSGPPPQWSWPCSHLRQTGILQLCLLCRSQLAVLYVCIPNFLIRSVSILPHIHIVNAFQSI